MASNDPTIRFRLDPRSGVSPYRQLVDQVREALVAGRLQPGDQLPAVREVVTQITINPNTVHRAYRELEYLGLTIPSAAWGHSSLRARLTRPAMISRMPRSVFGY